MCKKETSLELYNHTKMKLKLGDTIYLEVYNEVHDDYDRREATITKINESIIFKGEISDIEAIDHNGVIFVIGVHQLYDDIINKTKCIVARLS